MHGRRKRACCFFVRRVGVEAVRIKDIDVIEAHALQALIEAREHVLARAAALAVRARPHVPAGFRRNQQFVAIRPEVVLEDAPEVRLGAAVRRPIVVREIEMGDAEIECGAKNVALCRDGRRIAEVVPQTKR
jgi:hypothetical protein